MRMDDDQQQQEKPPPLAFPPLGLMRLTLETEALGPDASKSHTNTKAKRLRTRSKQAAAALADELPSPVSTASSKDYAPAKRRGFSAPSLKRSVTAVARMTDRLAAIPSLSRSASSEAQATQVSSGSGAAAAAAPVLQRAKTESEGASSSRTVSVPSLQSSKTPRTSSFRALKRSGKTAKGEDQPGAEAEERLCPLDSPVGTASASGGMTYEAPSKPDKADVKVKRKFPSLKRTSSKDDTKSVATVDSEPTTDELPPPVTIDVSPPPQESKAASPSPEEPAAKETPKRTRRKFAMPSLRRSSTSSSEKSASSFVVPTSDASAGGGNSAPGSSSDESTMESPLEEDDEHENEANDNATKSQRFGIPSLFRSLTNSSNTKRRASDSTQEERQAADTSLPSPGRKTSAPASTTATQTQPPSPVSTAKARKSMLPPVPSRFFSGMKPMFHRNTSTVKTSASVDKPAAPTSPRKAKTPSTAEEDLSDTNVSDEEEEAKEMRSLLSMLQVPRGRRESTAPLMSTGEEEMSF